MMDQDSESDWLEPSATSILLYSFLQSSSNRTFVPELDALGKQLWAPRLQFLSDDFDDGELQTDGNRCGRLQNREPVANEEIFRLIGTQLAELGDQVAAEIEPSLVNHLVRQFVADNLSREEITRHLSQAVQVLMRRMPLELEKEKAMLVIAMVLARNVANTVPSLLHRVFSTTVNYINHNLQDYVNNLAPEVVVVFSLSQMLHSNDLPIHGVAQHCYEGCRLLSLLMCVSCGVCWLWYRSNT